MGSERSVISAKMATGMKNYNINHKSQSILRTVEFKQQKWEGKQELDVICVRGNGKV